MLDPPPLAPTIAAQNLPPRLAMERTTSLGLRHVQLSATQPGMRPRELGDSARRDLLAVLRRLELSVAGLDLWIPVEHFADAAHADRAVAAVHQAIELAADLGRCPLSLLLPAGDETDEAVESIVARAHHFGVELADHAVPVDPRPGVGVGVDPAAWLSHGEKPADAVARLGGSIVSARLCDLNTAGMRAPVGGRDGRLDVTAYQVALSIAGYERPVVVDMRQWPDPLDGLERTIQRWHAVRAGLG